MIDKCLEYFNLNANVEVIFITLDEMRELNHTHMGVDGPTDVLAFPMIDGVSTPLDINPETGKIELGSIAVCKEYAELPVDYLIVHGFLHLLGYDHDTVEKKEIMDKITEEIYEQRTDK